MVEFRHELLHDGQRPVVAQAFRCHPFDVRLRDEHRRDARGAFHDVDDGLEMRRLEVLVRVPTLLRVVVEARVRPHPRLVVLVHDVV